MLGKCLIIVGSLCFSFLTLCAFYYVRAIRLCRPDSPQRGTTLSLQIVPEVVCDLQSAFAPALDDYISIESFLQASKTSKDQDTRLTGLAVLSKLANASQSLVDVRKSRIHVDKIALVIFLKDPFSITAFSCGDLLLNAQNAGYSVLIYFGGGYCGNVTKPRTQEEKLIPFAFAVNCFNNTKSDAYNPVYAGYDFLKGVDKTIVSIIETEQGPDELRNLEKYVEKLYYWFLLGPVITLEWLRRKKKLCCATTAQQVDEESAAGNEESAQLVTRVEESQEQNIRDIIGEENEDDLQPLMVTNNSDSNLRTSDNMRCSIMMRLARTFGRIIRYSVVGLGYTIVTLAALPVGISSGGWSFFRFDLNENYRPRNFWEVLLEYLNKPNSDMWLKYDADYIACYLVVWWPLFQIFCFFMYSRFDSASTWTVSTNFLKLIRSDWFSSNMYLLVLCVIIPYCSLSDELLMRNFIFFTVYNLTCTVCNFLFIIILNMHKIVTRYVFYISVCMICAYVESDIVAVFYFILNSQGALTNLKLTALRTVALGLTLTLSFNSSMHIIRKLLKPQESLFEELSEK